MAKPVTPITLGIDVAKDHLVCHCWHTDQCQVLDNQPAAIKAWLKTLTGPVRIAIEPTSHYHLTLVEAALAQDCTVYLVNARQLSHYRQAVNLRHKTDAQDAWLLARYLQHEAQQLRPFQPQDRRAQRLWCLITRRATVVQARQRLRQSLRDVRCSIRALMTQFDALLQRLDRQIQDLVRELGWWQHYRRCLSIPGIGPANAVALVAAYHRGAFSGSDAFVAYLGLDIRLRESGRFKGKSKLTKQGEPELRRLLYCASRPATSHARFADYQQRMTDKGLSKIAARVALARKLARIAFTLMDRKENFRHQGHACCTGP
jgi:transposase